MFKYLHKWDGAYCGAIGGMLTGSISPTTHFSWALFGAASLVTFGLMFTVNSIRKWERSK